MVSSASLWRVHARKDSSEPLKVRLLTQLIDSQAQQQAVVICNRSGVIVWANDFAIHSGGAWGLLEGTNDNDLTCHAQLKHFLQASDLPANQAPVHRFLAANRLFFEATLLAVANQDGSEELIGLIIDCHKLEGCGEHSLAELSPAEYRLLKSLESHRCLKEAATAIDISYENARTKLKRIFEKLDVHSQSELMSKVHHVTDTREPGQ